MSQQNIQPGSAPLLWSTVDEAFNRINSNFTELYLTISAGSSGAVDLTNLTSSLVPSTSGTYFSMVPVLIWEEHQLPVQMASQLIYRQDLLWEIY